MVLNEGMPHHRNPFDKGRLIITFKVSSWSVTSTMYMCIQKYTSIHVALDTVSVLKSVCVCVCVCACVCMCMCVHVYTVHV